MENQWLRHLKAGDPVTLLNPQSSLRYVPCRRVSSIDDVIHLGPFESFTLEGTCRMGAQDLYLVEPTPEEIVHLEHKEACSRFRDVVEDYTYENLPTEELNRIVALCDEFWPAKVQ